MSTAATPRAPWFANESGLALFEIPKELPKRSNGAPVHPSCGYRWRTAGLHGVRLRCYRAGGRWLTTREELARFFAAVSRLSGEA